MYHAGCVGGSSLKSDGSCRCWEGFESVIVDGGADEPGGRAKKRRRTDGGEREELQPPKMDQDWLCCDLCEKWHCVSAEVATSFGDGEEGEEWFW